MDVESARKEVHPEEAAQAVIQQGYAVYTLDPSRRESSAGAAAVSPARSE